MKLDDAIKKAEPTMKADDSFTAHVMERLDQLDQRPSFWRHYRLSPAGGLVILAVMVIGGLAFTSHGIHQTANTTTPASQQSTNQTANQTTDNNDALANSIDSSADDIQHSLASFNNSSDYSDNNLTDASLYN